MNSNTSNHNQKFKLLSGVLIVLQLFSILTSFFLTTFIQHPQSIGAPIPTSPDTVSCTPILIIAYDRATYLETTLNYILKYHPIRKGTQTKENMPVVISQEGNHSDVYIVIDKFCSLIFPHYNIPCWIIHYEHQQHDTRRRLNKQGIRGETFRTKRLRSDISVNVQNTRKESNRYEHLSGHYQFALQRAFFGYDKDKMSTHTKSQNFFQYYVDQVIVLEDDIIISQDFFDYFLALIPVLKNDESLLAISAWNDNGRKGRVKDPSRLLRTDFFPGLGWMMPRRLWIEVQAIWPNIYWDDWLRDPDQRKGRQVIRPEVSRSYHIGETGGASGLQNRRSYMTEIFLNTEKINWRKIDLSYLLDFESVYIHNITSVPLCSSLKEALENVRIHDVRLNYKSINDFRSFARVLKLRDDSRHGVLRTSYRGIVETRPFGSFILYLTPSKE